MKYIPRDITDTLIRYLHNFPAVAILGPRQCGKSTLASHISNQTGPSVFLDLERMADRSKLAEPEMFFQLHRDKLICLDEIQELPEIFSVMRSTIDMNNRNGQFLILGSASRDLIRQSSETLAGRIIYLQLPPFTYKEVFHENRMEFTAVSDYLVRGGFPRSFLARDLDLSYIWRASFIETFLQRDLPGMGFGIPPETALKLWKMCAHSQGQPLNASRFGESLGFNYQTVKRYLDILNGTFMLRLLNPFVPNLKKRLVKSPKIYVRDTGILLALLNLKTMDEVMGHPVFGSAWETLVIENVLQNFSGWDSGFYRTSHGAELDLVLQRGDHRIAIECKASASPKPARGFYSALEDLRIEKGYIIAPIEGDAFPVHKRAQVISPSEFLSLPEEQFT